MSFAIAGRSAFPVSKPSSLYSLSCSSGDFVSQVSTSQPAFFLGTSNGVDVTFQAEGSFDGDPSLYLSVSVWLATLFCQHDALFWCEPSSFLHFIHLAACDPRSNLLINHHTSHLFSLASCHLQFDRWIGGSPVRTERWLEGVWSGFPWVPDSHPVLSPDIRGSLVTCS